MDEVSDTAGPPQDEIVITYRGRSIRFEAIGGPLERKLRAGRFYEEQLLQYIESLQLTGAYVDVGAFVGTHTLFFAGYCPAARIHAFEPRRRFHDCLQRHLERNGLADRVELRSLGLSDRVESVQVTLDRKRETLDCQPLDQLLDEPVSLIKIDVEGMEDKVLTGAARILREFRPILFIESHTREELARHAALLAPYGYRPTGRVFNTSPTHEFAAGDSPTAPPTLLPRVQPLTAAGLWRSRSAEVESIAEDGRIRVRSRLPAWRRARVTQHPVSLWRAPADDIASISPSATYFLQAVGERSKGTRVRFVVVEYGVVSRKVHRIPYHPRLFTRLELSAAARRIRVAVDIGGPGELELEQIALHELVLDRPGAGSGRAPS